MVDYAQEHNCSGTKMRSILKDEKDMDMILTQQFAIAEVVSKAGLMPIVEPEIPINHPEKKYLEQALFHELGEKLEIFKGRCILKLTLPEVPNLYKPLMSHPRIEKVVGLSGG